MLILALLIGWLVGGVQIIQAASYFPKSIRAGKTYAQKVDLGKVSLLEAFLGILRPLPIRMVDGLFSPEITASVGVTGLLLALLARDARLWGALILFILLASGGWLFRVTARAQFRLPARWMYFVGLTLAVMAVEGFSRVPATLHPFLLAAQAVNLLLIHPKLWPMEPFVQRWERPSYAFRVTPEVEYWKRCTRVGGMPYPLTTGQIHHVRSLGYSGGAQLKAMAWLRNDTNPNGSGDHRGANMAPDKYNWWVLQDNWEALEKAYEQR